MADKIGIYAVLGATGNVGSKVIENLLAAAKEVRAIGRNADRLNFLMSRGVKAYPARFDEVGDLVHAFSGVDAVFTMTPTDLFAQPILEFQESVGVAVVKALEKAQVRYVVNLSSLGAQHSEGTGPVRGLHDQELRLNQIPWLNVMHLRPAYFMENLLGSVQTMKLQSINFSPLRADLVLPMIATQDVATKAAEQMLNLDFVGQTSFEFLGPQDLTLTEVTRLLGQEVGNPKIKYIQTPYGEIKKALLRAGVREDNADLLIEMQMGLNEGLFQPTQPRSAENTGRTTVENFSRFFALVYRSIPEGAQQALRDVG